MLDRLWHGERVPDSVSGVHAHPVSLSGRGQHCQECTGKREGAVGN